MNEVLVFGGTTEGRLFAKGLSEYDVPVIYLAATSYGGDFLSAVPNITVMAGRLSSDEISALIDQKRPKAIVDATHPYATEVKKCIRDALSDTPDIPCFRIRRGDTQVSLDSVSFFDNENDCAEALLKTKGNILLTTGTKTLPVFSKDESLRERLFVRVIPNSDSLTVCEECDIPGDRIIAAQGPFSKDENLLMIKRARAEALVMKESGKEGGEEERINAAKEAGVKCFVIKRPEGDIGEKIETVFKEVLSLFKKEPKKKPVAVALIGTGTKYSDLSLESQALIENASIIFGAKRVLSFFPESFIDGKDCYDAYRAADIVPRLIEFSEKNELFFDQKSAVILFSGDSGFFSGAAHLYDEIKDDPRFEVRLYSGISSISAFSSKLKEPWSEAVLLSSHGRKEEDWIPELLDSALHNKKTFLLTSGNSDVKRVSELLQEAEENGNGPFDIISGVSLGAEDEAISHDLSYGEGPRVLLIRNASPKKRMLSLFIPDSAFTRGNVPMTKEIVRAVSVSKLFLYEGAVLYDIGCGTGSVSCAAAALSKKIKVYSIDSKEEAIALTMENAKNLFLPNISVIKGEAPEVLKKLPAPDSVFIGGSKGRLSDIMEHLFSLGKEINVVVNAVTEATHAFLRNMLAEKKELIENAALDEVSVNANNTIYIAAFRIRNNA